MHRRSTTATILAALMLLVVPGVALSADEPSPSPQPADVDLTAALCEAVSDDAAAVADCEAVVDDILAIVTNDDLAPRERLSAVVDLAVAEAGGLDIPRAVADIQADLEAIELECELREAIAAAESAVRATLDEVGASIGELDLELLIDEARDSIDEVDVRARIDEALSAAAAFDPGEAIDDLDARIRASDGYIAIDEGVSLARGVVDTAQLWVEENPDEACNAGAFTVGAGAAAVVGLLTDSPGIAFAAYGQTYKVVDDACTAVVG